MPFRSMLFDRPEDGRRVDERQEPGFFADLNLDQVVESITAGRNGYNLKPFFYTPLSSVDAVRYRHEVLRDLQGEALAGYIRTFAERMRTMRERLAQADKLRYRYQREAWFLDAVETYGDAVDRLAQDLSGAEISSRGLAAFRDYLTGYAGSDRLKSLRAETGKLKADLAAIRYNLHIKGDRIRVSNYESEADYSAEVEETFEKFKQGAVKDYRAKFPAWADMNHVEAAVLDMVAKLHPDVFLALDDYRGRHDKYINKIVADFDREVQFYLAYLEYTARFTNKGLTFCFPEVSDRSKDIHARDTFDLALANKLVDGKSGRSPVVCNDFHLRDPERLFVVSGPNQGGKTTFARTFGQLHHLASLGLLVPGRDAKLFLFDQLFTHFEKEEDATNLRGKLEDDLTRIHDILTRATPNSVVIMNEAFTSTTLDDAVFLGEKILGQLIELDLLGLCVTFVDELSRLGPSTVSMVSTVEPDDPAVRTYKVVRRPADGLSYAATIAEKYGLTYERLRERIAS